MTRPVARGPGRPPPGPLTVRAWNCRGIHRMVPTPGLLEDADAKLCAIGLGEPRAAELDLVALVETWTPSDAEWDHVPATRGLPRVTVPAGGRAQKGHLSGGLALFALRASLDLRVEAVDETTRDAGGAFLWASVRAPAGVAAPRLYVAVVYIRPHSWQETWPRVCASIADFSRRGPTIVLGDFNVYTGGVHAR